jgi:hypothetical protein
LSQSRLLTLALSVFALGTFASVTHAADPADRPSPEESSQSEDTPKLQKTQLQGLPHRQEWELFRQAYSPARDCPDGTAMLIEVAGTVFFLECQRIHR